MNRIGGLLIAGLAAATLGGCVADGGYAYGGADYGYAEPGFAYGPEYDGYYGDAANYGYGYGWFGNYWYPGTGVIVYDRAGRGHHWNHGQQSYWQSHGARPGGPANPWRGRPQGNWTPPRPPAGHGFAGHVGRAVGGGHHGH